LEEKNIKNLTFSINNEFFGIPISKVREVIQHVDITPVHETLPFMKGVIDLRGKIIPILDMRMKFGIRENAQIDRTVFVIVDVLIDTGTFHLGITVDAVHDVVDINMEQVEKTPEIGLKLKSSYLYGITKVKDKLVMLLNIDKVLTTDEIISLNEIKN